MILQIGGTKKNNAFTLIEILLVVVIMGIVLALAAPNFSKGYSRFQLDRTADDLLTVSRWAQAMAIGQERIYALSFSDDRRSYELERADINEVNEEDNGEVKFGPVNGALGRLHQLPDTIRLDLHENLIKFYPDGTIDPAKIRLTASDHKTVISSIEVRGMMMRVEE